MRASLRAAAIAGAVAAGAAGVAAVLGDQAPYPYAQRCRVLRPGGRLIVGEFADRHHVTLTALIRMANDVGLVFRRRTGIPLAYYALLARTA